MKVAIIGGDPEHLELVDKELNELIEESGHYLFTIVGGYIGELEGGNPTLSQIWAELRGLPYQPKEYKDLGSMMHGVAAAADYIIFINDNSQIMKRFIMTYRQTGKHGSVINI